MIFETASFFQYKFDFLLTTVRISKRLHTMKKTSILNIAILLSGICMFSCSSQERSHSEVDQQVDSLLKLMTINEKIGQTYLVNGSGETTESLIKEGKLGSVINVIDPEVLNHLQKIAVEESRLGIPVLIGRDIIHGFNTIFPIPLGQAATWNPEIVKDAAKVAAAEARRLGIHWTFSPMLDVSRDARWGRIAESFGEDTYLTSVLGVAMVQGFQGDDLKDQKSLAACIKHFAAYGAAEGGRDYNTADMSLQTLHNVYLPPFRAAAEAGAATLMVSFNEINGIPSSGNRYLVKEVLKNDWKFDGMVVSDWASILEMVNHGFAKDARHAATLAMNAGIDMEMVTNCYTDHLKELIENGEVSMDILNDAVRRILKLKFQLGLFDNPYVEIEKSNPVPDPTNLRIAYETTLQSLVLLKNAENVLPLDKNARKIAILGPMADNGHDQMGTWVFDGDEKTIITPYKSIEAFLGREKIIFKLALPYTRSFDKSGFPEAILAARQSDAVIVFAGEESILSGEAHSLADITLPGAQEELIAELSKTGKPVIVVIMAGRQVALGNIEPYADAILYAWHPGTMGGPAISDVLFGVRSPEGRSPVSFPQMSGQEPFYYNHKNTGRPPREDSFVPYADIPLKAPQTSLGNTAHYLDAGYKPLYPFGHGLSYTTFEYGQVELISESLRAGDSLLASVVVKNTGSREGTEVVQLYIRDLVGSTTRPVKELKAFKKIKLQPHEATQVGFKIPVEKLGFYNEELKWVLEPWRFYSVHR